MIHKTLINNKLDHKTHYSQPCLILLLPRTQQHYSLVVTTEVPLFIVMKL